MVLLMIIVNPFYISTVEPTLARNKD